MEDENDSIGEANLSLDETSCISESAESDDEDAVEPTLKYERFGNDINLIVNRDSASCLAVHSKFIVLGTHWGQIHILDFLGNNIRNKELTPHSTTINDLCIDTEGNYIASCSDDGKVVITGLYTNDNNQIINFDRPIKSVALDPLFSKPSSSKGFIAGDDKLILHEKAFPARIKTSVIHQGDGSIESIKWRGQFVAWSTGKGVHVYDLVLKRRISFIARHKQNKIEPATPNRCSIFWQNDKSLIIGQDNNLQVCHILEQSSNLSSSSTVSPRSENIVRYVEINSVFTLDFTIIGVAAHATRCVILTCDNNDGQDVTNHHNEFKAERPHLRSIDLKTGDEVSNDFLTLKSFEKSNVLDYRLECSGYEDAYYVVCRKDVIVARPRDEDDHVDWMISREKYEQARDYAILNSHLLRRHTSKEIGFAWFDYLMDKRKFDKAAQLCPQILGRSKELWEDHVRRFNAVHQLGSISMWLPIHQPRLDRTSYEAVLRSFLVGRDATNLHKYIHTWPSDVYRIDIVIEMVMGYLESDRNNRLLLESLAQLYALDHRYEKALYIYVRLGHKDVFEMIRRHDLFEEVFKNVIQLMDFDTESTVKLLVQNHDKILPDRVVSQFKDHPKYLFEYLHRLHQQDASAVRPFALKMVQLYCDYNKKELLAFLKTSSHVPLQAALQFCEGAQLMEEAAYLLDRMGNPKQALKIMLKTKDGEKKCVEFCRDKNDAELWQDLLDYSIDKPMYLSIVLENVDSHVDTYRLISQIPQGIEIPGLRNSLVRILHDFQLLISLSEGCMKILLSDCIELTKKFIDYRRRALRLDKSASCPICSQKIILKKILANPLTDSIYVFRCGHAFHSMCLESIAIDVKLGCMLCSGRKR